MRIALDAMGGDNAPDVVIDGALLSLRAPECPELILVGPQDDLEGRLERLVEKEAADFKKTVREKIRFHDAKTVVGMHDPPTAVRRLPDSSITRGVGLVKDGEAQALITAGNTGAAVAATTLFLRKLEGVRRPGIAATLPSGKGLCTIMDVGANVQCKPVHLYQYGVMAANYHRRVHGVENPRVGLLNIGEESAKGNDLVKQTRDLFEKSRLNFVGNIEGQDIFSGRCHVVVCEGFVGNVVLKVSEGLAGSIFAFLRDEIGTHMTGGDESTAFKAGLERFRDMTDYAEYGGALLLGVDGICVICHGRSEGRAISNAVLLAARLIERGVNQGIVEGLQEMAIDEPSP